MVFPGMVLKQDYNFCKVYKYIRLKVDHSPFHSQRMVIFKKGAVWGGEGYPALQRFTKVLVPGANSANKR